MKKTNKMNYTITLNGNDHSVYIVKKKIKRIIIRINIKNDIIVSAPEYVDYNDALNKVFLNTSWIEKQLTKNNKIIAEFFVQDYIDHKIIYLLGVKYNLQQDSNLNTKYLKVQDTFFYKTNVLKTIELIFLDHYQILEKQFALVKESFQKKVEQSSQMELRKMKSRWGSCNYQTGKIVLNKQIICLPLELINYVIVHEFTHLIYPNHSKEYYAYLSKILPNYKNIEKKLKKYSFLLFN